MGRSRASLLFALRGLTCGLLSPRLRGLHALGDGHAQHLFQRAVDLQRTLVHVTKLLLGGDEIGVLQAATFSTLHSIRVAILTGELACAVPV